MRYQRVSESFTIEGVTNRYTMPKMAWLKLPKRYFIKAKSFSVSLKPKGAAVTQGKHSFSEDIKKFLVRQGTSPAFSFDAQGEPYPAKIKR